MLTCELDDLATCLEKDILVPYATSCNAGMQTGITETMKQIVRETKQTAPRNAHPKGGRKSGSFASAITHSAQKLGSAGFQETWHVKAPEYPLAHLLVNGHALRQGGRTKADPFLKNALEKAEGVLLQNIINEVK